MKPSVQDMIAATQKSLRENVAPAVEDQWAASALRSIDLILSHLQARTKAEGPMLYEDNCDLVELLSSCSGPDLSGLDFGTDLATGITLFLAEAAQVSAIAYPSVDVLCEFNVKGRELVDAILVLCIAQRDRGPYGQLHRDIRAYLDRHIEREHAFYFPTFVGRPV